jgi:hypothetical protein
MQDGGLSATRLEETKSPTVGGPRLVRRGPGLCVALPTYEGGWVHRAWQAVERALSAGLLATAPHRRPTAKLREQFEGSKQQKLPTIDKLPTMQLTSEQPGHRQQLQPQYGVPGFFAFLAGDVPAAGGRQGVLAAGRSGATIGAIGGGSSGAGASAAAQPSCPVPDVVRRQVRWSDPQVVLSTPVSAKVSWPAHGS